MIYWADEMNLAVDSKDVEVQGGPSRSFKIIQGHRNEYQSKAHMRFLISLPLYIICLLSSIVFEI